jgi:hypothetical protein
MNEIVRITGQRQELKEILIRYREKFLRQKYGWPDRKHGILRRNMLDAILDCRPQDKAEFHALIPWYLIANTADDQLEDEVEIICAIVNRF